MALDQGSNRAWRCERTWKGLFCENNQMPVVVLLIEVKRHEGVVKREVGGCEG